MTKSRLQQQIERLGQVFAGPDYFEAHEQAGRILAELAADSCYLHDIAAENINAPDFFDRPRINPVLALKISQDHNYSLIGHCWLPLDDGRTDLTHQSVHHHGKLLLTSMSAWGRGYESVLFKKGFRVTGADGETQMQIDKIYKNPMGHLEFIGPDTPHVVFFPASFTVTYALWSRDRPRAASILKRLPGIETYKKKIKATLERVGLASSLGLNSVSNLDFYPKAGRLIQMKDRVNYLPGSHENFLQNFFWCLQQMKFERLDLLSERIKLSGGHPGAAALLKALEKGEPIARRMEHIHLGVERVQFGRRELLECFPRHVGAQAG